MTGSLKQLAMVLVVIGGVTASTAHAQASTDSAAKAKADSLRRLLSVVRIEATRPIGSVYSAPRVSAGILTTGAKSEVVDVASKSANLSEKVARQIFAEVPGIFVYDMDGSGNQINVSARGLDAHRSWEFNVRQNCVLTTSDLYGYPASHYSAPMEAVERVELIRGTAALQYGSQFGGLLNYVIKSPDTTSRARFESRSTLGSFGLKSTWNAVGGKIGGVSYYGYATVRESDGYRLNGESTADAQYLSLGMPLAGALSARLDVGRSYYRYRQPGPLTDAMFSVDPRRATRSRNWYSPDITVPSLTLVWTPSRSTRSTIVASGLFGTRSSVAVGGFATSPDTANASGVWSARQVDIDRYTSRTVEWRVQHTASVGRIRTTYVGGLAYSNNDTHRRQQGTGSRGSNYSLALESDGDFRRDLHYRTRNLAAFAEAELAITSRWALVPGLRVEQGTTRMTGRLAYYDPADTPRRIQHRFPLVGMRSSFILSEHAEWYTGVSQSYRPMILKDALPESVTERTDNSLRDARGWTGESGIRGTIDRRISYDVGGFVMRYANRFGLLTVTDDIGFSYTYKTNVGTTRTAGLEGRFAAQLFHTGPISWSAFSSLSFMDAKYVRGTAVRVGKNVDIAGNQVESAPRIIARQGVTARTRAMEFGVQRSYVSRTFADALNSMQSSANGAVGLVPAYTLFDLTAGYAIKPSLRLSAAINNLFDRQYFTKRPQFYPGPGVWPSDGRAMQLSLTMRP